MVSASLQAIKLTVSTELASFPVQSIYAHTGTCPAILRPESHISTAQVLSLEHSRAC